MNPHKTPSVSILSLFKTVFQHKQLTLQLAKREIMGRYRGSILGLAWSFFHPLIMLTVYTFVFGVVFKAKWGVELQGGKAGFAVILFSGLIVHGLFAEVISRSPLVILENTNYVKKVIFPLEILPVVSLVSAMFHTMVSIIVLFLALLYLGGMPWTVVFLPIVLFPLVMFSAGVGWFLAAVGVYVRDVSQVMGVVVTLLLFGSTVFFPLSHIPEKYQIFILLNPLTYIIEQSRAVAIYGQMPEVNGLMLYTLISTIVMWFGYVCFQKMRRGFADVI